MNGVFQAPPGSKKIEHLMRKIRGNPSKYSQWFHMEIAQVGERASFYFREEYLFSKREV